MRFIKLLLSLAGILFVSAIQSSSSLEPADGISIGPRGSDCTFSGYWLRMPEQGSSFEAAVEAMTNAMEAAVPDNCSTQHILLKGQITESSAFLFKALLEALARRNSRPVHVNLDSPGGLISAAMEIGDLIAENNMAVGVGKEPICYSACAFVFAAGRRRVAWPSSIGIHRPSNTEISTEDLNYGEYLDRFNEFNPVMKAYFSRYGVSPALVDAMNNVPSSEIRILGHNELQEFGLGVKNIAFEEYDRARTIQVCGHEFIQLQQRFRSALDRCERNLTPFSETYYQGLDECRDQAIDKFPSYYSELEECTRAKGYPVP